MLELHLLLSVSNCFPYDFRKYSRFKVFLGLLAIHIGFGIVDIRCYVSSQFLMPSCLISWEKLCFNENMFLFLLISCRSWALPGYMYPDYGITAGGSHYLAHLNALMHVLRSILKLKLCSLLHHLLFLFIGQLDRRW